MTRWSSISHECRIWTMKILSGMSPIARCKFGTDSSGTSFYTWPLVNLYLTRRGWSWRCHTIITKEGSHFGCDFQVSSRSYPLIFFRTGVAHSYLNNQQPEFWHILPMPCLPHAMAHQPRRQKLPAVEKREDCGPCSNPIAASMAVVTGWTSKFVYFCGLCFFSFYGNLRQAAQTFGHVECQQIQWIY